MKPTRSLFKNPVTLFAILALGPLACGGDGDGDGDGDDKESKEGASSKAAKKKVIESAIDDDAVAALLGKYERADGEDTKYYKVEISDETIRCNHSNHKNEYKNHKYSLAAAEDGSYLLIAKDGFLTATNGGDDESWEFDATGICAWGLSNPYKQTDKLEGKPKIGIHPDLTGKTEKITGSLESAVDLPWGSVTVDKVKGTKWKTDDETTHVLEIKMAVQNSSEEFVDFTLPSLLEDHLSGEWISAECDDGDVSSKGVGNTLFDDHKSPAFAEGGGWSSVSAPVGPGKSRKGWVTLLMDDKPSDECVVTIDSAALGGGAIVIEVSDI